jgi:hypothetical protein
LAPPPPASAVPAVAAVPVPVAGAASLAWVPVAAAGLVALGGTLDPGDDGNNVTPAPISP